MMAFGVLAACDDKDQGIENDTTNDLPDSDDDTDDTDDDDGGGDDVGGNTLAEATPASWAKAWGEAIVEDAINEAGDRDFYALDCEAGYLYLVSTFAYGLDGDMDPDTVIRVYDPSGNMFAENDDMPYRYWETDSAMFFEAQETGTYTVEVLEWSDWDPDSDGATGGSSYEYELWGIGFLSYDTEPNDTQKEADAIYDDKKLNMGYYGSFFSGYVPDSTADYVTEFYGDMEDDTDIDVWPIDFSKDSAGSYYQWSLWPMDFGALEPVMSLYDEDWNLLASTEDPAIYPGGARLYDVGMAYRVPEDGGRFYMEVTNAAGTGGVGTSYTGMILGYVETLATNESEDNDFPGFANTIDMEESTSTAGYYYGAAWGVIEGEEDLDNWKVLADDLGGTLDGQYLSVYIQAEQIGSLLDAKIIVYDEDAKTVLAEETVNPASASADPEIWDLQLGDIDAVYISVESESVDASDLANGYLMSVNINGTPLN
jgi:hypothetical protein